jgi:galactose-1-phosphate uridylyltransferase
LYHPHLQVVVEPFPTVSQGEVIRRLETYHRRNDLVFWEDLIAEEIGEGKRYLGRFGDIHFLAAFSPGGIFGEILILFAQRALLSEVSGEDWTCFSKGLGRVFNYLAGKQYFSFNLALFSGTMPEVPSWVYARLCPRMLIPPWNTSDINYFEKLHNEVICVVSPEEISEELQPFFLDQNASVV